MSSESIDFSQEPKKVFLSYLIKQLSLAEFYIFVSIDDARGLNVLDGIIDSLNEASQTALKEIHDEINRGSFGKKRTNARDMYAKVSAYLAKTYLEECQFGIVPTSTIKGAEKASTEKIPRRLKANL